MGYNLFLRHKSFIKFTLALKELNLNNRGCKPAVTIAVSETTPEGLNLSIN